MSGADSDMQRCPSIARRKSDVSAVANQQLHQFQIASATAVMQRVQAVGCEHVDVDQVATWPPWRGGRGSGGERSLVLGVEQVS